MDNQNQTPTFNPFQPLQPAKQPINPQPDEPVIKPHKPARFNKRLGWVIAVVVLVIVTVASLFVLKSQADAAAIQYAKDMDAHFEEVFAESNHARRTEIIKDTAILKKVFLGPVISAKYKQVSTETKKEYLEVLAKGSGFSLRMNQYGSFIKDILNDLTNVLKSTDQKMNTEATDKIDIQAMESTLVGMLEKSQRLDEIADKVEKAEAFKKYQARDALIAHIRAWSDAQHNVVKEYLAWIGDITEAGNKLLKDFAVGVSSDAPKVNEQQFKAKIAGYIEGYKVSANLAVDDLSSMVDELGRDPITQELAQERLKLNEETAAFREKLTKIIGEDK